MIEDFIDRLSQCNIFPDVENQYSPSFAYSSITRNNLTTYLKVMNQIKPTIMLIGEAPGYNGCRWSGIPFTAEKNIMIEYLKDCLFGINNGYTIRQIEKPQSEASATIVWGYLQKAQIFPLIWNAFPFHPYKNNDLESNRKPKDEELQYGKEILKELINMYKIQHIISVGNTAYETLSRIGIKSNKVRHPANGGKSEFIKGLDIEFKNHPTTAST